METTVNKPIFLIRDAVPADLRFIINSWSQTNVDNYFKYNGGARYPRLRRDVISSEAFLITGLLQRPNYITKVACDIEDNDHIYGFICYEPDYCPQFSDLKGFAVDFIYTKLVFRRFGVGSSLLGDISGRVYVSNSTPNWSYFTKNGNLDIQFVPEVHYRGLD